MDIQRTRGTVHIDRHVTEPARPNSGNGSSSAGHPIELQSVHGDKLVINPGPEPPAWLLPTIQSMASLLSLPANWNSYGARPIDPRDVVLALDLLDRTMQPDTPPPAVAPTARGGLQLEWHLRGIDLEVEPLAQDQVHVFYEDQGRAEMEDELGANLAPLAETLAELSRRT